MRQLSLFVCCAFLVGSSAVASAEETAEAKEMPGIKVGERAPEFTLKDQNGQEHSLTAMLGKGKVALVFHRSADW